jgi:hypothetical protein
MKTHPELIYQAANKLGMSVFQLIYDAYCHNDIFLNSYAMVAAFRFFLKTGITVRFVEDYALDVLAERVQKQSTTLVIYSR